MQRKKFLALMLTAALAGQPAAMPVLAEDTGDLDFSSEESLAEEVSSEETGQNSLPVISEDLPEGRIIYYHNEKANPLKIRTEDGENLRYLWLESDDNETFHEIQKTDIQQDERTGYTEENTKYGEANAETEESQSECSPEYTPPTDTPGSFYYKVRIWRLDETDEEAYTESSTVCIQVLEEEQSEDVAAPSGDNSTGRSDTDQSDTSEDNIGNREESGKNNTASDETSENSQDQTGDSVPGKTGSDEENCGNTDAEEDEDSTENPDGSENADNVDGAEDEDNAENTDNAEAGDNAEDPEGIEVSDNADTAENLDTSEDADATEAPDNTENTDSDNAENTENGNGTDGADSEGSDSTYPESGDEADETAEPSQSWDNPTWEKVNHLPVRNTDVPESETYETEGYWNVDLSQIFRDPDGDPVTCYEKGERDENWTEVDGDSYLCHLKNAQETYIFTAKDQEGYGDIYAVTLKKKSETDKTATKQAKDADEDMLSAGEARAASTKSVSFETAYKETGAHLAELAETSAPVSGTLNGDWMVIGLARSGQEVDSSVYSRYKSNIVDRVKESNGVLHNKKYTEYSRTVLGLTAIGEDVTNVGGYNLLQPLADFDQTIWQGINGTIWALLAFDSHDYEIPTAEAGKTQTTREKLIDDILSNEVSGGGWSMIGGADSDVTGMALQALAPYYNSSSSVKAAVDRAVKKLTAMQLSDGTFGTVGHSTSESCSQVVTGLSALGIDCDTDSRFIKNGHSLLQGLLSYYDGNGGFLHVADNGYDQMATEQAYYAMTAYSRMKNGQTFIYDMTDVAIKSDREKADEVKKLIDALPSEITLSNFQQVKTAYAAYNGLNATQKSVISKADKDKLINAYNKALDLEVKYVENLIKKIGKVTLASEEKITDAKIAYNSLSSAQQKKVSNYAVLQKAEKELQKLKKPTTTATPTPAPAAKPSGKPGTSVDLVTPRPTAKPTGAVQPTPTVKPADPTPTAKPGNPTPTPTAAPTGSAQPSRTKSAGGSTKSASGSTKSAGGSTKSASVSSGKSSSSGTDSKDKNTSGSTKKSSSEKSGTAKNSSSTSSTETTQTAASKKVIKEMKAFFNTKGSKAYPEKIDDYTDKQIRALGKTWKNYEKLSEGEKKAVQENKIYESFRKLLTSLGTRYHFDQSTGTNLDNNKEDALPWYVQVVVNPKIADDSELKTIRNVLGEKSEVLSLNEIHFVDTLTGDNWNPKDVLKVQLPMADLGDYKSCMIVHITDEGKVEFLKGKLSGSYISFDAAEFSAYGIVGFMGDSDEILSGQEKDKPVWPWLAAGSAACILVILMGGIRIADSRKKKGRKK